MSLSIKEQLAGFKPDYISVSVESLTKAFMLWEQDRIEGNCISNDEALAKSPEIISAERAETLMEFLALGVKNGI